MNCITVKEHQEPQSSALLTAESGRSMAGWGTRPSFSLKHCIIKGSLRNVRTTTQTFLIQGDKHFPVMGRNLYCSSEL